MGGEPGLQVGVDPVSQAEERAAVHAPAFLRSDHVASDLGFRPVSPQQQVERGILIEAGERDDKPARTLKHGRTGEMEQRHQGVLPVQAVAQARNQAIPSAWRQSLGDPGDLGCDRGQLPLRR
jgi:hypothetical protein